MGIKDSKRTKVMPICKLCLQEKELCESHIIPKFVYRPVNDEKRREVVVSENKYSIVQNGVKIPLLCKECEGKLSNYEMELKWFLKDLQEKNPDHFKEMPQSKGRIYVAENYAFNKIHKAIISIFWRLSQVIEDCPFAKIYLGPYEEKFRKICLEDTEIKWTRYPIYVEKLVWEKEFFDQVIMNYKNMGRVDKVSHRKMILYGTVFHLFLAEDLSKFSKNFESVFLGGPYSPIILSDFNDVIAQSQNLLNSERMGGVVKLLGK